MAKLSQLLLLASGWISAASGLRHLPRSVQKSVPLDLTAYFNNKGFGTYPGEASLDGSNESYPDPGFASDYYTSSTTGVLYAFPGYTGPGNPDNVISAGQTIAVPSSNTSYFSASFLAASDLNGATVAANVTFTYSDNSTSLFELRAANWWSFLTIDRGEIILPFRYTANGTNYNTSHVFERTAALAPGKTLASITLPVETNVTTGRLHVFGISLWRADELAVQAVRPTQKWIDSGNGTEQVQVVEVTVNNAGSACIAGDGIAVSLAGAGVTTVQPGTIKRLCPGDQKIAQVGVLGSSNGTSIPVTVSLSSSANSSVSTISTFSAAIGLQEWTSDLSSLAQHEAPDWFADAKFGIFLHWGPFSVTGWGNSSPHESYAEWFWWYSTHHPQADASDFYDYRLRTYGKDWAYDDTFPSFNASAWQPREWVDLFADAGARYFVLTTKHHDGFALFDTGNTTNRSAVHYGPRRDLLGELFDAAAAYQPQLKRGTYFSLPEWFNPDFGPYGFDQTSAASSVSWPGILAKNPYTNATEPYTGRVDGVNDFITDLMVPQMDILASNYSTDLLWCDCGAANGTAGFAARWFNAARAQGRQVAINSRCGIPEAADFDTPEYATFSSAQARKWESNQGMDPYSYGYNRATPDSAYMNASTIVYSLVDMVAKNGNFLLDIGPKPDGTVVQREADNLREAGRWIKAHAEAVFDTSYWFVQTEAVGAAGEEVRFTQTDDAFYILFLDRPVVSGGVVEVPAPVPVLDGDVVSLVGVNGTGTEELGWAKTGEGSEAVLRIEVAEEVLDRDEFCWVFKVAYA